MAEEPRSGELIEVSEVAVGQGGDSIVRALWMAIFAVVIVGLTGILYFLVTGVLDPPAPRTALEAQLVVVKEAVRLTPGSGQAWADYVRTLTGLEFFDDAHEQVETGRKTLKSGEQLLYLNLANVELLLVEERYQDAYKASTKLRADEKVERDKAMRELSEKNVMIDPSTVAPDVAIKIRLAHAKAAANLKKWPETISVLNEAIEFDEKASDLLYLRGEAKRESGDTAGARADYNEALKYNPDYAAAKLALEKVGDE